MSVAEMPASDAPIQIVDHLAERDVTIFVDAVRRLEEEGRNTRFVVAPSDLGTTTAIQKALAGSLQMVELPPLQPNELAEDLFALGEPNDLIASAVPTDQPTNRAALDPERHWLRGGLPPSLEAESDVASMRWRVHMLESLFAQDYSRWAVTPSFAVSEALAWVADQNGGELDVSKPPMGKRADARSAIWVLQQLGLVRALSNFPAMSTASLSRMQKVYLRDSGLLHALLGIETTDQLRSHAKRGESWETYALETLIVAADDRARPQFYREEGPDGLVDEIDLVLDFRLSGGPLIGIECKLNPEKTAERGFRRGMAAIGATDGFVVHSGAASHPGPGTPRLELGEARQRVLGFANSRKA